MKALLLIAHGSRRQNSNDEIRQLTLNLKQSGGNGFDLIDCAFLELTTPGISEQIDKLVDEGATEVILLPYFLAAGHHVVKDLPVFSEQAKVKYPEVSFILTEHIGANAGMLPLIMQLAQR